MVFAEDDRTAAASSAHARRRGRRRHFFVGREAEVASFRELILADPPHTQVLLVYGPGGVGKTTLLREFARIGEETGAAPFYIDARHIAPAPDQFTFALASALGHEPTPDFLDRFEGMNERRIVLVDTYETMRPLDTWIREEFLNALPERTVVVLAGRDVPSAAWRTDPGWYSFIRPVPLRNLSPHESQMFLDGRNVPSDQYDSVARFTHGHPLALALVAEVFTQRPDMRFLPHEAPDIVQALMEKFLEETPDARRRAALEVCALIHATTEAVLAEVLGKEDAAELFKWLRDRSFVDIGPMGLFPHDLARDVLAADLRWRNPDRYAELHRQCREYYVKRLNETTGLEQQRILFDYIYLHRDNPLVRPFFEWKTSGTARIEPMRPDDTGDFIAMIRRHEGKEIAAVAGRLLELYPEGGLVVRDSEKGLAGILFSVPLHVDPEVDEGDPALRRARAYLKERTPLRKEEVATYFRFWMARDTYQGVSPIQSLLFLTIVQHYLTTPRLAFTFIPCADPEFWAPVFAYADLARLSDADFTVGLKHFGVYGHDWRARPPMAWLELLGDREIASGPVTPPPEPQRMMVVLSRQEFAESVRNALKVFGKGRAMDRNPLLQSRLVLDLAGRNAIAADRAAALQELIVRTAEEFKASPKTEGFYGVLHHTYFWPAPTQEQAADILNLSFGTYRRHLKQALDLLTDALWTRELGENG